MFVNRFVNPAGRFLQAEGGRCYAGPVGSNFGGFADPVNGMDVIISASGYGVIGHQRGLTVNNASDVLDYSSKISRNRRVGYGRYSSTMSLDALWVPTASGITALRNAIEDAIGVVVILSRDGVNFRSAYAMVSGFVEEFPDQAPATLAIDLDVDGQWVDLP